MILHFVSEPTTPMEQRVYEKVRGDVCKALQGITANSKKKFIVNPTVWYSRLGNRDGKKTFNPRVMNSADYLSRKLGENLLEMGWKAGRQEKKIEGQKIDGYIELPVVSQLYEIKKSMAKEYLKKLLETNNDQNPFQAVIDSYFRYYMNAWFLGKNEHKLLKEYFSQTERQHIRVGLEFETGNIASSFRALSKLNFLYTKGMLDFGVFITSIDKATTACQIWPSSNRNGSFEELSHRNYKENIQIPLLEIGFQPDKLDNNAKYLKHDGGLFELQPTKDTDELDGARYRRFTHNGSSYWKKL